MLLNKAPVNIVYDTHRLAAETQQSGSPDLIACRGGESIAIELKCKPNKLSRMQDAARKRIELGGGAHVTCYTMKEVYGAVRELSG